MDASEARNTEWQLQHWYRFIQGTRTRTQLGPHTRDTTAVSQEHTWRMLLATLELFDNGEKERPAAVGPRQALFPVNPEGATSPHQSRHPTSRERRCAAMLVS